MILNARLPGSVCEQLLELGHGLHVLVPLQERERVVVSHGLIIGRERERALEQQLRIVEDLELHADARQQAHPLHMITVLQEIAADDLLGRVHLAVGEHAVRGDNLLRQVRERRDVCRRLFALRFLAGDVVKDTQRIPARRKRRVDVDRSLVSLDRGSRLAQRGVAMASFLEEPTVRGMQLLKSGERREGFGNALQIPLSDRDEIPHVAILRHFLEQGLRSLQRLGELTFLEERAQAQHLRLDT